MFFSQFSKNSLEERDFLAIQGNSGKITDVEGEKYAF